MSFDFKLNKAISLILIICIISLFIFSAICQPAYALAGVDDLALLGATAGVILIASGLTFANSSDALAQVQNFLNTATTDVINAINDVRGTIAVGKVALSQTIIDGVSSYLSANNVTSSGTYDTSVFSVPNISFGSSGGSVTIPFADGTYFEAFSYSKNSSGYFLSLNRRDASGGLIRGSNMFCTFESYFVSVGSSLYVYRGKGYGEHTITDMFNSVSSVSFNFDAAYAPSFGGDFALNDSDLVGFPQGLSGTSTLDDFVDLAPTIGVSSVRDIATSPDIPLVSDGEISPDGSGDFNIGKFILSIPILGHILQALLTIVDGISNIVNWLTSTFVDWLSGLFSGIQSAIISAINSLGSLLDRILDKIGAVATSIISAISGIWADFAQWFPTSPLGIAINGIKDFLSNIFDLLKDILKALAGFLDSIIDTLPAILGLLSGYTLFMILFNHFLPAQVVVVLWAFFECCIAVLIFRLILGR